MHRSLCQSVSKRVLASPACLFIGLRVWKRCAYSHMCECLDFTLQSVCRFTCRFVCVSCRAGDRASSPHSLITSSPCSMTHGNDGSWALGGSTETFQSVARSRNKFRDTSSGMSLSPAASPLCSFARPQSLLAVASASRTGGISNRHRVSSFSSRVSNRAQWGPGGLTEGLI